MKTIREIAGLREQLDGWRQDGETIAFVPTMGGLHKGHVSLAQLAGENADRVVASIFVNPTQFGRDEDFDAYPRSVDTDRRRLSRARVDVLFVPAAEEIYPFGPERATTVSVPGLSTELCGAVRPGHFVGVTSVVNRLFNIVAPDVAVFGQKDYQQFVIIQRMVADLHLPMRILMGPTVRERDGLALSSRNRYLTPDERERAAELYAVICDYRDRFLAGDRDVAALESRAMRRLKTAGFDGDYVTIRTARELAAPAPGNRQLVALGAARLGRARLIDNVLFELSGA